MPEPSDTGVHRQRVIHGERATDQTNADSVTGLSGGVSSRHRESDVGRIVAGGLMVGASVIAASSSK